MNVVEICKELIAINSINPFRYSLDPQGHPLFEGREQPALDFCEKLLLQAGFQTSRQDCGNGRENLLAEKGQGKHAYLLYGHVDTVEVKEGWTQQEALTPQLQTQKVDGKEQEILVGLGSNDMKGGVACILKAVQQYDPQHYKLKVVLGCDEEFYSLGSHILVNHSDYLADVKGILVPEIGESLENPAPNSLLVTLGRCGRIEIEATIPGSGGHGAEPHGEGKVSAITQASILAHEIEKKSAQQSAYLPFESSFQKVRGSALVTRIEGGDGILSIPDSCRLVVNFVLTPRQKREDAFQFLNDCVETLYQTGQLKKVFQNNTEKTIQFTERKRPTPPLLPYVMDERSNFVTTCLQTIEEHANVQLGIGVSVADENRFAAEAQKEVIVLGPRGENSHAAFEWVTIESLVLLEKIYVQLLQRWDQIEPQKLQTTSS